MKQTLTLFSLGCLLTFQLTFTACAQLATNPPANIVSTNYWNTNYSRTNISSGPGFITNAPGNLGLVPIWGTPVTNVNGLIVTSAGMPSANGFYALQAPSTTDFTNLTGGHLYQKNVTGTPRKYYWQLDVGGTNIYQTSDIGNAATDSSLSLALRLWQSVILSGADPAPSVAASYAITYTNIVPGNIAGGSAFNTNAPGNGRYISIVSTNNGVVTTNLLLRF